MKILPVTKLGWHWAEFNRAIEVIFIFNHNTRGFDFWRQFSEISYHHEYSDSGPLTHLERINPPQTDLNPL